MSRLKRGLLVALLHALMVSSLGGKLLWDRQRLPRVWTRAMGVDPDLPIRGRYVQLLLVVEPRHAPANAENWGQRASLKVEEGRLVAEIGDGGEHWIRLDQPETGAPAQLTDPVLFFLPEHVPDPTVRAEGEELWAEVTVPKKGPPRPIQLGVRRAGGEIEPLGLD